MWLSLTAKFQSFQASCINCTQHFHCEGPSFVSSATWPSATWRAVVPSSSDVKRSGLLDPTVPNCPATRRHNPEGLNPQFRYSDHSGGEGGAQFRTKCVVINLLAPELLFFILAHPVYKMWIIQEANALVCNAKGIPNAIARQKL